MARRRPMTTFLALVLGIGWPMLTLPLLIGLPSDPFLLGFVLIALLAPALLVTRLVGGPGAAKRLMSRVTNWRFGVVRWAIIVLAVPAFTLGFAAATGTLDRPADGVLTEVATYLFATFVFGALIVNTWEELAWGGFARVVTPFYRYLLGLHLLATGGSILAIGVQHAAWNAAGNIDGVDGQWQSIAAVVLLTLLLAIGRRRGHMDGRPINRDAEKATAREWQS